MILHLYVKERGLGEVFHAPIDVILDRHTIAVPDLVYVSNARASIITERCIEGTPDLLVEILSPSTADRDRGVKAKLYARFGVEHYWILDADARVLEAFSRSGGGGYGPATPHAGDAVLRSALFPGLALDLSKVWA
jgi:Uma2 family endonuclease